MKLIKSMITIMALLIAVPIYAEAWAQTAPRFQQASRALVAEARQAEKAGKLLEARLAYERAVIANPQNVEAYAGLASVQADAGDAAEALKYYGIALEVEPNHLPALAGRGVILARQGDIEAAEAALTRLTRLCGEAGCAQRDAVAAAIAASRTGDNDG